jgi:hypothetical protein
MTLNFEKRIQMEDYPCFPEGVWRVSLGDGSNQNRSLSFNGKDIRQTPYGLFLRHGNGTQTADNRRMSFVPWWRVESCLQVETSEGD